MQIYLVRVFKLGMRFIWLVKLVPMKVVKRRMIWWQQMSLAYGHVKDVLSQFDASMDNIVDETWFVTDIDDCMAKVEELFAERQRLYGKAP